jgi:hypothetical protein
MSNIFSVAINDIFSVNDFIEILTVNGVSVNVCSYVSTTAEKYTEFGYDSGRSIAVTCKCTDWEPERGQEVTFRGKTWRVTEYETDSHALCYKIYLKSLESK